MRPVSLGRPNVSNDPEVFRRWVLGAFAELERASVEDAIVVADDFSVTGHTPTRTIDASTATTAEIANVLCTLIEDLQNRGMKRSQ